MILIILSIYGVTQIPQYDTHYLHHHSVNGSQFSQQNYLGISIREHPQKRNDSTTPHIS